MIPVTMGAIFRLFAYYGTAKHNLNNITILTSCTRRGSLCPSGYRRTEAGLSSTQRREMGGLVNLSGPWSGMLETSGGTVGMVL